MGNYSIKAVIYSVLLLCITSYLLSCVSYEYKYLNEFHSEEIVKGKSGEQIEGKLFAGFSKIDITPLPGKALAGYSLLSGEAIGVRHHLYSNILYLSPSEGRDIVIIQLDLFSGSLLLHRTIAKRIEKELNIPASNIVLVGTHSHSGPGNYLESRMYNHNHSTNSGFDQDYFDYLVDEILIGIIKARSGIFPAAVSTGQRLIPKVTRNRSIEAYLANRELTDNYEIDDDLIAVNQVMTMLRVDKVIEGGRTVPMGALTGFSIHGTALPASNRYYSSDVFSFISRELEWYCKAESGNDFTHLVTSGVHGDVSPAYKEGAQGFSEAERLGVIIGKEAIELHKSLGNSLEEEVTLSVKSIDLDLLDRDGPGDYQGLPERAYIGYQATGGAEDGKNLFMRRFSFVQEGNPASRISIENQGLKRPVLGRMQKLFIPDNHFPHYLMLQIIQINNLVYIPLPFEVTGMAGKRISESLMDFSDRKTDNPISNTSVISCSNGYFGYLTTEEEYGQQHYEGASNLYGNNTLAFVIRNLQELSLSDRSFILPMDFSPGPILTQNPVTPLVDIDSDDLSKVRLNERNNLEKESFWEFKWINNEPEALKFNRSFVKIERFDDNGTWTDFHRGLQKINDLGYEISTEITGKDRKTGLYVYAAHWYTSADENQGVFRFSIIDEVGKTILSSEPFSF